MDMAILLHDGLVGPPDYRSGMSSFHDTTRPLPSAITENMRGSKNFFMETKCD
jgi:hypothetical protein